MDEFIDNWVRKAGRYWIHLVAIFADLAGLIAIAAAFLSDHGRTLTSYYVIGMLSVLWALVIVQEFRYARKSAYSEVSRYFHAAIHFLQESIDEVPSMSNADLARNLERALTYIATAFGLVTKTGCRACVKVLSLSPDAPKERSLTRNEVIRFLLVRTFARDQTSDRHGTDEIADYVSENSDFEEIFKQTGEGCFFENNLKKRISRGQYRNYHIPAGYDNKRGSWPLVYRSTIVWPIRRMKQGSTEPHLLGFLCVDSGGPNVFIRRYDYDLGAAFADALYMYMVQQRATFSWGGKSDE